MSTYFNTIIYIVVFNFSVLTVTAQAHDYDADEYVGANSISRVSCTHLHDYDADEYVEVIATPRQSRKDLHDYDADEYVEDQVTPMERR